MSSMSLSLNALIDALKATWQGKGKGIPSILKTLYKIVGAYAEFPDYYAYKIVSGEKPIHSHAQEQARIKETIISAPQMVNDLLMDHLDPAKRENLVARLFQMVKEDYQANRIYEHVYNDLYLHARLESLDVFLAKIILLTFRQNNSNDEHVNDNTDATNLDVEEITINVDKLGIPTYREARLSHNMPPILDRYIARKAETELLNQKLADGHKIVFIWGPGGEGKTEFAIQFCTSLRKEYDCYFTSYKGSIEETILQLEFKNWSPYSNQADLSSLKPIDVQYQEKLDLLSQYGDDAILIVDNADSPDLLTDPKWRDMERLDIRQLYTTRYEFDKANVRIDPFSAETLYLFLQEHYISKFHFEKENVIDLIEKVECHTLTVDLIGRLLKKSKGRLTPKDILAEMEKPVPDDKQWVSVAAEYNRDYTPRTLYHHLQKVFDMSGLLPEELYIMKCVCLFYPDGVDMSFFLEIIGQNYQSTIDSLCETGWLRFRNRCISMHALVQTICHYGEYTRPRWIQIWPFQSKLIRICHDPDTYLPPRIYSFPAVQAYGWLENAAELPDIPDSERATVYETLAWELHFVVSSCFKNESPGIPFLSRLMDLNTAATLREEARTAEKEEAKKASQSLKGTQWLKRLSMTWYKIGAIEASMEDHDYSANYAFRKAAGMLSNCEHPNYYFLADLYGYTAYSYLKMQQHAKAKRYLRKAYEMFGKAEKCNNDIYEGALSPSCFAFSYPPDRPQLCPVEENTEFWQYERLMQQLGHEFIYLPYSVQICVSQK